MVFTQEMDPGVEVRWRDSVAYTIFLITSSVLKLFVVLHDESYSHISFVFSPESLALESFAIINL